MFQTRGVVPPPQRKLIYSGIDIPSVSISKPDRNASGQTHLPLVKDALPRLKHLPLDGIAVQVLDFRFPLWPQTVIGNNLFSGFRYTDGDFAPALDGLRDLQKAPNLTDNFLPIATSFYFESGEKNKFDWFDDKKWDTTRHNLEAYAKFARASQTIKGFILDTEPYKGTKPDGSPDWAYNLWSMNNLYNLVNKAAFAPNPQIAYREIIRKRGREFAETMERGFPGAPLLIYWANIGSLNKQDPAHSDLWPLFMDGIFEQWEAMRSPSYAVDGCETAYLFRSLAEYQAARKTIREGLKQASSVPKLYDKYLRVGFGKWLDPGDGGGNKWDIKNPDANFYTPSQWEDTLKYALQTTDEYVWIWSGGQARVFPLSYGRDVTVGSPYYQAMWRAKAAG